MKDEDKIEAFVVASKYNLLIVDYVVKPYELDKNNLVILPFLKERMKKLDYKDRAVLICSLMLHDHFNCEDVGFLN